MSEAILKNNEEKNGKDIISNSEDSQKRAIWRANYMRALRKDGYFEIHSREELPYLIPGTRVRVPLEFLRRNKRQPRIFFDEKDLHELSSSIDIKGDVNEPIKITIRQDCTTREYFGMLVGGERRLRASKISKLSSVSCMICPPINDDDLFVDSAVDNMGKVPLTPIEEALTIMEFKKRFNWSDAYIAKRLSKSRLTIMKIQRYLNLLPKFQQDLLNRKMTKAEALILSKWGQSDQEKIHEIIQKLKEGSERKTIHPNDLDILVRRKAEELGLKKNISGKRGRKQDSSADLSVNKIMRGVENFMAILRLAADLKKSELEEAKIHILDVIGSFEGVVEKTQKIINKYDQWS